MELLRNENNKKELFSFLSLNIASLNLEARQVWSHTAKRCCAILPGIQLVLLPVLKRKLTQELTFMSQIL